MFFFFFFFFSVTTQLYCTTTYCTTVVYRYSCVSHILVFHKIFHKILIYITTNLTYRTLSTQTKHTGVLALDQITTDTNIKTDVILRHDYLKRRNFHEKRVDYSIIPTV